MRMVKSRMISGKSDSGIHEVDLTLVGKNVSSFIRKGQVGSHKEEMTPEMINKFNKWTDEYNKINGTNITL